MPRPSHWERTTFLRSPDVLIIGAGLTGLQAAVELKRLDPKQDVLVIERAPIPRGASTRNAGFACFGAPTELLADLDAYGEEDMVATVRERFAGIKALEERYADRDIGWVKHGGFEIIDEETTARMVRARLPRLNELLAPVTGLQETWRMLSTEEGQKAGAPLENCKLLLHNPLEAQLHPAKLVSLLVEDCRQVGVRFLFGAAVSTVAPQADGSVRIEGMDWGNVISPKVLVTVNAFSRQLLPEDFPEQIRPVRNQVLLSRPLPQLKLRGCYHYHEGYVYFRNVGEDRLLIGGARHRAGSSSETDVFAANGIPETFLLEKLNCWFPEHRWTEGDFPTRWSGIIAQGNGKTPVLRYAAENVLVAGRLAGMGVALSGDLGQRAAAKLMAITQL
ncbi:MAG: FAD-dependent oxidoreductase [Bacteroidota bacterium]